MFNYYLKLSWLSLKSTPVISFLMVLAIAIGIGVSMTTLTLYHMMNINPMGDRQHMLHAVQLQIKGVTNSDRIPSQLTYMDAMVLRQSTIPVRHTPMFKSGFSVQLDNSDIKPFFETTRLTDNDFFAMFDLEFIYGGAWDDAVDDVADTVVVIIESLNQTLFGGQNSVGKTITLDGKSFTIVGVVKDFNPSPKFYDLTNGSFNNGEAIFMPFSLTPIDKVNTWGNDNSWKPEDVNNFEDLLRSERMWLQYWVEFDNLEQKAQYQDMLNAYVAEQKQLGRFTRDDAGGFLKNVQQWLDNRGVVSDDNSVMVGLSFMFLAVCMVNTIGLLLAKFLRRAAEVGVRRALGASQSEVFKQHLIEIGLVGSLGGVLGLVLTYAGLNGVRSLYTQYQSVAQLDLTMVVAAFVIAIVSSVLAGMYPAYRICKTNPAIHLKTQ